MKVLALHLPQYHVIPENNEWWGNGFTDWVNVKKAKPLFKGHEQPLIPYKYNYYDMTNVDTIKTQAETANKFGIYGFIYYHYWFNGKKLLEKPCEILLKNQEIKTNYCFCWANETWARTWDGKEKEILIKQTFGGIEDWKSHIKYLINFFKDERYIKINNRPIMFFYSCNRIDNFNNMIEYWNEELKKYGFDNLLVVEFVNSFNSGKHNINSDIITEFEPLNTARYSVSNICKLKRFICKRIGIIDFLSYDYIWKCLLNNKKSYGNKKIFRSAFVNFDNSPRKGKKSLIMKDASPEKFKAYLADLIKLKNRNYDDSFLIINAWNEWAEGAVLEPSENYGYKYLEAVRSVLNEFNNNNDIATLNNTYNH